MKYLKKYFSYFTLTISILLIFYVFFKSEIYWDGNKRDYYKIYYLISLILISFSIITFFINQKVVEYLIIIFFSFIISAYFFEGYLTFKKYPLSIDLEKKAEEYKKITGLDYDLRSKFEIYNDLKQNSDNIGSIVYWSNSMIQDLKKNGDFDIIDKKIFPLSGLAKSLIIHCNENGYYSQYESDRFGFNNPDEEWNKDSFEYFVVGDSFVHGACVNRPHDISSNLRNSSKKEKGVINLGQGLTGPLKMYARLREYLKPNVSNIIWVHYDGNDLSDLNDELKSNILKKYLQDENFSQNLELKQGIINKFSKKNIEIAEKIELQKIVKNENIKIKEERFIYNFVRFIKLFKVRYSLISAKKYNFLIFEEILRLTNKLAKENKSNLYFVFLYGEYKYNENFPNNDKSYKKIKEILEKLNIPLINIHENVFLKQENPLFLFPFQQPGHYTIEGYQKVANEIHRFVNQK